MSNIDHNRLPREKTGQGLYSNKDRWDRPQHSPFHQAGGPSAHTSPGSRAWTGSGTRLPPLQGGDAPWNSWKETSRKEAVEQQAHGASSNPNPALLCREQWATPASSRLSGFSLRADDPNARWPLQPVGYETGDIAFEPQSQWSPSKSVQRTSVSPAKKSPNPLSP